MEFNSIEKRSKHDLRQLNNTHIVLDSDVTCTENMVKKLLASAKEIVDLMQKFSQYILHKDIKIN